MWAWPDVLQYPWQLPVCGHTLSRHLQAGLQPRVRLSVPGAGAGRNWKWGGVLSSGSWAACPVAPVWLGPFPRPCVRQTHGVHPA